jgi:predicted ATPase/DNA-binding SARP family transcriptional activator
VRVRILGPLEVEDDSGRPVELGSSKQQALLALLSIHPNIVISMDRIILELWGDSPPLDGRGNVHVHIARLRSTLEPERLKGAPGRLIVTEAPGYVLRIDPEDVDAFRFERLVAEARAEIGDDSRSARKTIHTALDLWRGSPLSGQALEEFAQSEIRRLEEVHLSGLELMYEASIDVGEHGAVIPGLEKLVAEHPLREGLVALLMRALAGSGRQTEALRAYRSLELRLGSDIGLAPSVELRHLEEHILLQQEPRSDELVMPEVPAGPVGHLPARLTSFVGRERDLGDIVELLGTTRLLTLTGPGGVGKTSLAIESARAVEDRYQGRVWLIDLSPLSDGVGVTSAIADVLDIKHESTGSLQSTIADVLGQARSLLLLDNCEHVIDVVSVVAVELLQAAPELTIICTSRRSVALDGESVYEVPPLGLPTTGASVDELRVVASSLLFSERAMAVSHGFDLTAENASAVATLCLRLDGIPLAIELAASNLRSMTTRELANSLDDRLSFGGSRRGIARHRTLRDTIQWSYDLLEDSERALFDRLSVFVGRFSRYAALTVGASGRNASPSVALAALVDASMIVADVGGHATSYRMLPTLRDFGLFNLRDQGELERVRAAHAAFLCADAEDMALPLAPFGSTTRIERNVSMDGFRAAADWALRAGRPELAMTLVLPIGHHSIASGRPSEAAHWLSRVNDIGADGSLEMWRLRTAVAVADWLGGRNEEAEAAFRSLYSSAVDMGESDAAADALLNAGYIRWRLGDLLGARDDMTSAAETGSDRVGRSHSPREGLAVLELHLGNISAAEEQAGTLDAFADRTNDPVARTNALNVRGWIARYQGELDESVRCFEQCYHIAVDQGDMHTDVNARLSLAGVFPALGLPNQALAQAVAAYQLSLDAGIPAKQGESLVAMGPAYVDLGDPSRAAASVADGLRVLRDRGGAVNIMSRGVDIAGQIALAASNLNLAVRFLIAARVEDQRIHYVEPPADAARSERALTEAKELVGDAKREELVEAALRARFADVLNEAIDYLEGMVISTL